MSEFTRFQHPTRWTLLCRKKIEVNTDPQRRCYNGVHARSEMVWTAWGDLCHPATKEDGEDTMATFQCINRTNEYKLLPPTQAST